METGRAEQGFITRDDFERDGYGQNFYFLAGLGCRRRLDEITDGGGVDVEGNGFLHPKTHQRDLLLRRRGKRIEIENRNARGVIGQNDGGGAALLGTVYRSELLDQRCDRIAAQDIILDGRCHQRSRLERLKSRAAAVGESDTG